MAAGTATARGDRIELRAAREEKRLLVAASERIVLPERDTERVLALLDSPPEPTPALVAAASRAACRRCGVV